MDIQLDDLLKSYLACRQHKRNTKAALEFEADWESNLMALYRELVEDRYMLSPSTCFVIEHPVKREIFAASFRDRIVHHYLAMRLEPIFEKEFIHDSYSCRKGKGTLFGVKRLKRFIAQCSVGYTQPCYVLQCDLRGFFMSIDRQQLAGMLDNFLGLHYIGIDLDTLRRLTRQVASADPLIQVSVKGHSACNKQRGLPIGNLTSQLFANFYMNSFDHYCKSKLGLRYYGRYVDDFFVVHTDPDYLKQLMPLFRQYLQDELGLTLHPDKTKLTEYRKGISFLGTTVKGGTLLVGKRTKGGAGKAIYQANSLANAHPLSERETDEIVQRLNSYLGLMRQQNSRQLRANLLERLSPAVKAYIQIDGLTKVVSAFRIRQKTGRNVDRECRRRIRVLKLQNHGVKVRIDYKAICNEIWMERRYGIKKDNI